MAEAKEVVKAEQAMTAGQQEVAAAAREAMVGVGRELAMLELATAGAGLATVGAGLATAEAGLAEVEDRVQVVPELAMLEVATAEDREEVEAGLATAGVEREPAMGAATKAGKVLELAKEAWRATRDLEAVDCQGVRRQLESSRLSQGQ